MTAAQRAAVALAPENTLLVFARALEFADIETELEMRPFAKLAKSGAAPFGSGAWHRERSASLRLAPSAA